MKRIFAVLMVLVMGGMARAAIPISSSCATPTVTVCMRSDTTGLPVTGITAAHVSLKYTLSTGYLSAALTGEAAAYNAAWAEPTAGYVGWYEEITSASTGIGTYRIYLPAAIMTSPVVNQCRTISVIDSTDSARAVLQILFTPADSSLTGRLESVIMENGCTTPTIYVVMARILNGVETIGTGLTISNFDLYYTEYRSSTATKIDISALAAANSAYGGSTGVSKAYEIAYGIYRIDLPPEAVDGGAGTTVRVFITDGTYSARKEIQLTPSVNSVLAGGSTIPTTSTLVAAIMDDPVPGVHAAGSAGYVLGADIADIKGHADYIPSVATGQPGSILIAGSNAATTFASVTLNATEIVTAIINGLLGETSEDHVVSGSVGEKIATIQDPGNVWNALTSTHTTAGTFGKLASDLPADTATATMNTVVENSLTFKQIFKILAAVTVGKSSYSGGIVTFTGLDGTTVRARVTISGQSRTTVTGLDGN